MSDNIIEIFGKYDSDFFRFKQKLEKNKKLYQLALNRGKYITEKIEKKFNSNNIPTNGIENLVKNKRIKLKIDRPPPYKKDSKETNLKKSINNINDLKKYKIVWKSCREIIKGKKPVILPKKIDYSNFNQGNIGDCYFISCVNALSQIPQLLYFIMGLSDEDIQNENPKLFKVKFFIDGKWTPIYIEDSFPCFPCIENKKFKYKLIGVTPKDNELFMMILEKAWAKINGGYDQIDGGIITNIFELFLGCKCDLLYHNDINAVFDSVKENEKYFGNLTLSSSKFGSGYHAYSIIKTLEMYPKGDSCKIFIISNPHGKTSNLESSRIDLNKIEEILQNKFGIENKSKYEHFLNINNQYQGKKGKKGKEGKGIIYMPLEYYKTWSRFTTVCYPHYSCPSYIFNIQNELECLYIYEIQLSEKQLFTCQVCFQSFRAHRDIIDKIKFSIKIKENEEENLDEDILLYYNFCGIKIIKNNENLDEVEKYYKTDLYDESSIKELNTLLDPGKYFIMIYPESSINKGIIRFLSEKKITYIKLVNKINKYQLKNVYNLDEIDKIFSDEFKSYNYYKQFFNFDSNIELDCYPKEEYFLPGIKEYYIHFKKLAKSKGLSPEDAIYSITKEGNAYNYAIIDPNTYRKIFSESNKNGKIQHEYINLDDIEFIDYLGLKYKESNYNDLIKQIKLNRNPFIFCEYDENINMLTSSVVYIDLYHNKAKNEDILVILDKPKHPKKRIQKPLFIIILDISGSMSEYQSYLQNNIIPKLLNKLGYIPKYNQLSKIIKDDTKNIPHFEILQAITSRYILKHFLEKYDPQKTIDIENFKDYSEDIIPLITFSDDSELYFYNIYDFEKCCLYGGTTYFENAAKKLGDILNSVSRERSIRLLSFSDGLICNEDKSIQILDKILNSIKTKHQINSVSVRVFHGEEPDTKILMKLSTFSHPITDMEQIVIDTKVEKDINEVVNKIFKKFNNDDMEYYLKIFSNIDFISNDFSENFSREQFFNTKYYAYRINCCKNVSDYQKSLKFSSGKLVIKDRGELDEKSFYNIMSKCAPYIAQRILERKVNNKDNLKQNKEIIDYFKKTEESFEKQNNNDNILNNTININNKKKEFLNILRK